MTTILPDKILPAARSYMTEGKAVEAAEMLEYSWLTITTGGPANDLGKLHAITLELADRFPASEAVSTLLHRATVSYAKMGEFPSAAKMAERMLGVWRARCQAERTLDTLTGILHALDTLASVSKAWGAVDVVTACLVELIEWNFDYGNTIGVAWAVRELGSLAFAAGDLDNAEAKFTRAHELYAEDAEDVSVARERAECHVLLGRVRRARGDDDAAQHWFKQALAYLTGDAAEEVQSLLEAVQSGRELPDPTVLKIGEFGLPIWESTRMPPPSTQSDISA